MKALVATKEALAVVRIACFFFHSVKKTPNSHLLIPNYLLSSHHPYADTSILLCGLLWTGGDDILGKAFT